ncbi:hypothetical protein C815_02319 [Firmicutes bacterium M10-2]|nr:hypothetical protein C815_02319 [Firmicutes bacterium M10-2]
MKTRILTALLIILVVAFPIIYGGWPLELLALFIVVAGCWEWLRILPDFSKWIWLLPIEVVGVLASRFVPSQWVFVFYACFIMFFWALPIFFESISVNESNSLIVFFVLFSLFYCSMGEIIANHMYLWTIVFATYGSDTGAYFIGRAFGKHKMNPRISPKKSWEGFFGGIISGAVISMALSSLYWAQLNTIVIVLLCLLCPIFAEVGDLCFSAIKRNYKIKDFSDLLPGHGGVLDRVDSLLINILVFGVLFHLFLI